MQIHIYYVDLFYRDAVTNNNYLDILLAIVSNGSIAGWLIWSKAQFVWAALVALSQLITAIRPHLPFQKRSRSLESLNIELTELLLYMEDKLYDVSEGKLNSEEIHHLTLEMQRRKQRALTFYLASDPLPENTKRLAIAQQKAKNFFQQKYLGGN